jgi:phage-related baseplate assembly protein
MSEDIKFIEIDAQSIQNDIIKQFEDTFQETLYPGDERRIFLLQEVPIIVGLKNSINDTAKQNLLKYARGSLLDEMGERVNTPRLPAQYAYTTLRFTLSATRTENTKIPAGTRGTPDGTLFFATTIDAFILAGQLTVEVRAKSTEAGEKYNGFAPEQIKSLWIQYLM